MSALLVRVATQLGISRIELAQIEAVLRIRRGSFARAPARDARPAAARSLQRARDSEGASDEEVVKAYRRQLSRHHPDKLKANGLPDSMIEHAKQRTQQIIEAYELIRERRGTLAAHSARPFADDFLQRAHAVGECRGPRLQDDRGLDLAHVAVAHRRDLRPAGPRGQRPRA